MISSLASVLSITESLIFHDAVYNTHLSISYIILSSVFVFLSVPTAEAIYNSRTTRPITFKLSGSVVLIPEKVFTKKSWS